MQRWLALISQRISGMPHGPGITGPWPGAFQKGVVPRGFLAGRRRCSPGPKRVHAKRLWGERPLHPFPGGRLSGPPLTPPADLPRRSIASSIPHRALLQNCPGQIGIQRSLAASLSFTALPGPHTLVGWPSGRRCPGSLPNSRTGSRFLLLIL